MSALFWSTPELRLRTGSSRLRQYHWWAALLLGALALILVAQRGHVALAVVLSLPAALPLSRSYRDSLPGLEIRCHQGRWRIGRGVHMPTAELVGHSIALPWVVFIALRPARSGAVQRLWLFRDAMSVREYRRLRVTLTLAG